MHAGRCRQISSVQAVRALVASQMLGPKLLLRRGMITGLLSLIKPQHLASLANWEAQPGNAGQLPGGRTVPGLVAAILQDSFLQPQSSVYRDLYQVRILPGQLCHQAPFPEQKSGTVMLHSAVYTSCRNGMMRPHHVRKAMHDISHVLQVLGESSVMHAVMRSMDFLQGDRLGPPLTFASALVTSISGKQFAAQFIAAGGASAASVQK